MGNALVKKELSELEKDILKVISTSEISTPGEISNILDVEESLIVEILNNDEFYNYICASSMSIMRLAYHSKAIPHLIRDLDTEVKFYDSYDRLIKAIGNGKDNSSEGMKVSLEVLLKNNSAEVKEKDVTPHTKDNLNTVYEVKKTSGNIFEITDTKQTVPSHLGEIDIDSIFEDDEDER